MSVSSSMILLTGLPPECPDFVSYSSKTGRSDPVFASKIADIFRAVVCGYPLEDMLRFHKFMDGPYWVPAWNNSGFCVIAAPTSKPPLLASGGQPTRVECGVSFDAHAIQPCRRTCRAARRQSCRQLLAAQFCRRRDSLVFLAQSMHLARPHSSRRFGQSRLQRMARPIG